MHTCPLCLGVSTRDFCSDRHRRYFHCDTCTLIFADPDTLLSSTAEKAVYDHHQNSPEDEGYRQFLSQLANPLSARLGKQPLHGLDFGSGPGSALPVLLQEKGYRMAVYDPYYAPDPAVLAQRFDFITCTEAIEHFYQPAREWRLLLGLLKPGGWLGLMTSLTTHISTKPATNQTTDLTVNVTDFAQWHYKNDPTHVSFFSHNTFQYLAERDALSLEFIGPKVILLRKPC